MLARRFPKPRATFCALVALLVATGCQPKGNELGDVERVNTDAGTVGRYMVAYYASLFAIPGGGALVTWMKEAPPYRPVVYRRVEKAGAPLGKEEYLTPPDRLGTITIGLTMLRGKGADDLYAAWQARKPETGDKFVMFRTSRDGGATWSDAHMLNTEPTAFAPSVATDSAGGVYVAWPDERGYTTGIFANRSLDRGDSWLPADVRIDNGEGGGRMANAVSTATDGHQRVVLAWEEQASTGRVVMSATSNDRGATWSTPTRVDDGKGRGAPLSPRIAIVGDRVVVAWTAAVAGINSFAQVWADSSSDGGVTWGEDVLIHEQPGGTAPTMQLFADGGTAALAFEAKARAGNETIYYVGFQPDGTWAPGKDALTPITPAEGHASSPRLGIDEHGTLYLVYTDGPNAVRLLRSKDGGVHWDAPFLVYERPETTPTAAVRFPQIAVGSEGTYVMWEEWGESNVKTLGDAQTKKPPLDLFLRRITFHD